MQLVNAGKMSYVITQSSSITNKAFKLKLQIVWVDYFLRSECNTEFHLEIKAMLSPVKNLYDHEEVWVAALAVTRQPKINSKNVFSHNCMSSIS